LISDIAAKDSPATNAAMTADLFRVAKTARTQIQKDRKKSDSRIAKRVYEAMGDAMTAQAIKTETTRST
jgi:hypothetical protein